MTDTLELCRWTYNEVLAIRKNAYEQSKRVHRCPFCGLTLGRDHNAALNILRLGLQSVAKA